MKTLWNAVSFLAVVHLLALIMFALWLWQSDRLSVERIEQARSLFASTIADAQVAAEEAEREAQVEREAAREEAMRANPPVSSEARMQQISWIEELESRAARRLGDEHALLIAQLEGSLEQLVQREEAFRARQEAWEASVEAERARRESEQFAKAVRQYESVPPRQGKSMLIELIDAGSMEQAVAYLDAMNARAASKIISEFKTEKEITLATELLERLRKLGLDMEPSQTQEPDNARGNIADAS